MNSTTGNPAYLEPLGPFTVHTTVSTNARVFTVVIGLKNIGLFTRVASLKGGALLCDPQGACWLNLLFLPWDSYLF